MRANDPAKRPFDKQISELGATLQLIAKSRIEIDAARLIVMNAASKIDQTNSKSALTEIAEAKIYVPTITMKVIDRAMQVYGAEGMDDSTTPLSYMWAYGRTLRIADGPDEVHLQQLGRNENKRNKEATAKIHKQRETTAKLFAKYGIDSSSPSLRSNL
jgi:acyl-CoA dehydrogenase